jgi:hypothetical protein
MTLQGGSGVPGLVHGPQRTIRLAVSHPPLTIPSREMTASAYRLHDGVNRQATPVDAASGASERW